MADIIMVEKNPLDDLSILENKENIKLVIKEGRVEVDRR
jgi:imidazolonepropionase-like amidohydrolase